VKKTVMPIAVVGLTLSSWVHAADTPSTGDKSAVKQSSTAAAPTTPTGTDQLTLDATTVTGNRELPKVMYIVPWKKAELGQLPGQPFNSLVNEVLQPLDREEFQRQVKYYQVVAGKDTSSSVNAQPTASADSK
jgi:hypothetical protein